jgi:glycosyltransferase involved in cell wall biosynthesis
MRYLCSASVAFFPSLWENFPYACLEAMSCGCAVVTSDCGGFREIVNDGECGLSVEPDSTEAIITAMHRLLDDPGLAGKLGENARKRSADIADVQRICAEMEQFYSHAAGY